MIRFCKNSHSTVNKSDITCPVCGERLFRGCPQCRQKWDYCCCDEWFVWYFVYAKRQVFWLLQHGLIYPNLGNGNIAGQVQTSCAHDMPGVSIADTVAEVDARVKRCGDAGRALLHEAIHSYKLSGPSKEALYYCSGWQRKRMSFRKWQKQNEERDKKVAVK